jgi:hypothetical protein
MSGDNPIKSAPEDVIQGRRILKAIRPASKDGCEGVSGPVNLVTASKSDQGLLRGGSFGDGSVEKPNRGLEPEDTDSSFGGEYYI